MLIDSCRCCLGRLLVAEREGRGVGPCLYHCSKQKVRATFPLVLSARQNLFYSLRVYGRGNSFCECEYVRCGCQEPVPAESRANRKNKKKRKMIRRLMLSGAKVKESMLFGKF